MIRIALAAALLFLPLSALAEQNEPFKPGLGEIMTLQQMRHLKLWLAVQAGNWGLADYELDELKEGFEDITKYYPTKDGVPTGTMAEAIIAKEVAALAKAIDGKDKRNFASGFDRLTAACNACHQASKHDFIAIKRPSGNPYTNQSFTPAAGKSDVRHDRH
jgi:hypothetical protein